MGGKQRAIILPNAEIKMMLHLVSREAHRVRTDAPFFNQNSREYKTICSKNQAKLRASSSNECDDSIEV